jgi:type I restriction enzyme S subunit
MFGLKQEHIDAIRRCFAAIPAIREVVIYGSRAKETHKPGSDIDLTIIDDDISSSDLVRLDSALDDLMLPYKFDLSLKRKIKNPDLIDHINRVGKIFYQREVDKSEWKEYRLEKLCTDISYGYTESANVNPIGPKFLRITDIVPNRINWENVPYCKISTANFQKYKLEKGDIVIARTGATTGYNKTIKEDVKSVFASYLIRYKIDTNIAYPFFIGYVLQSRAWYDYVDAIAGGSAQPGANAKQLGSFDILLPPLPEQRAIASALSSLDDKIDLLHQQNATLEKMAETLFRQWFVEEAKEEWEMGSISDIAIHSKIPVLPQKESSVVYNHYSIPAFDSNKNPIKELGREIQSNKYSVLKHSILFSKLNPHKDKRIWLLQNEVESKSICSTEFQVILPKHQNYLYFLYSWLSYNENYSKIASGVGGTSGSHQRIDSATIFSFQCPIVSIDFIDNYNQKVESLFKKQVINQTQIRTLTTLRDTLLPKLMSGEAKVEK